MTRQLARLAPAGGFLAILALLATPARAAPRFDGVPLPDASATAPASETPESPIASPEAVGPASETPPPAETAPPEPPTETPTSASDVFTAMPSPVPTEGPPTPTDGIPPEPTRTPADDTPTPASEPTPTLFESLTATPDLDPTPTPTDTPTPLLSVLAPAPESASYGPGAVLINEIAWAGTDASPNDEWIELWNPGPDTINLSGWILTDGGDLNVALDGEIAGFAFVLLERTDESTISDIAADRVYTGALANAGETMALLDPSGNVVDSANESGGAWPAGSTEPRASMERHGLLDLPGSWRTFAGLGGNGLDAAGNPIHGTPRQPNSPAPADPTATPTATETLTPTSTAEPGGGTPFPAGAVLINEVAWAGTHASTSDEWIELIHPGDEAIDLDGWRLTDGNDIDLVLSGSLDPGGFYLLERSDDWTISDLPANRIYTGALANDGEMLMLLDPTGAAIDVVNPAGNAWPAGDSATLSSMERGGGWRTFSGFYGRGRDADGNAIRGTPGGPNSILIPTPAATWIPGAVVINELLIRPRYDWEGAGGVTTGDEFIELYNRGPGAVYLRGWILDDVVDGGSAPYTLPGLTLEPKAFAVFFRTRTRIALNDSGDSVRLSAPDGSLVDRVVYQRVRAANLSFGRLPDGDDVLVYGLWPTPGERNQPFQPPTFPVGSILINEIAWAGSEVSADDEWIELWNPGVAPVDLFGWTLTDDGNIRAHLSGVVPAGGWFLLERGDQAVAGLAADLIYKGALANAGERLRLIDPSGAEIDIVNPSGGAWPAGDAATHSSMARSGSGWITSPQASWVGWDSGGRSIRGSPRISNEATDDLAGAPGCARACP